MRDVTPWLVPATDAPIALGQHERFLRHMAALHAEFWACGPEFDVVPAMHRYLELSPWTATAETAAGSAHLVPQLVGKGWPLLAEVAPAAAAVVTPLARDPGPLVEALATTPHTFVHSNCKLDNLGTDDAGRTVVLDWEQPGHGAPLSDLAWYLAINCRRLPQSKEDSIAAYRRELEACGIDTEPWWDRQLALCLLGALVQFGWEKALRRLRRGTRMVGDARRAGGRAAELTAGLRAGYDAAAPAWADGPGPMYARLARALVAAAPVPVAGAGCWTWARGRAWRARPRWPRGHARWWGPTCRCAMLRRGRAAQDPAVPARRVPVRWPPTRPRCRSATTASTWCWPRSALTTWRTWRRAWPRPGGSAARSPPACSRPAGPIPPRTRWTSALRSFGYQPPAWYAALSPGSRAGDPAVLAERRGRRGLHPGAGAHDRRPTGLTTPAELASWRLGMAQVAPFVRELDAPRPAALRRAAERAVAGTGPLVVTMTVLTAR